MPERLVRPHPDVILTDLSDGTGVLLHLRTKFFFTLNETGVALWKALSEGATRSQLVDVLLRNFDVDGTTAHRDVGALLEELALEQLIVEDV